MEGSGISLWVEVPRSPGVRPPRIKSHECLWASLGGCWECTGFSVRTASTLKCRAVSPASLVTRYSRVVAGGKVGGSECSQRTQPHCEQEVTMLLWRTSSCSVRGDYGVCPKLENELLLNICTLIVHLYFFLDTFAMQSHGKIKIWDILIRYPSASLRNAFGKWSRLEI